MSEQRPPEPPRSHAQETDADTLGASPDAMDRPGDVFPPDEPLGAEDAVDRDGNVDDPDSVAERSEREEPERGATRRDELGRDLLDPSDDPDLLDDEQQAVARRGTDTDSAPEVAAVHDEPDSERPVPDP